MLPHTLASNKNKSLDTSMQFNMACNILQFVIFVKVNPISEEEFLHIGW